MKKKKVIVEKEVEEMEDRKRVCKQKRRINDDKIIFIR